MSDLNQLKNCKDCKHFFRKKVEIPCVSCIDGSRKSHPGATITLTMEQLNNIVEEAHYKGQQYCRQRSGLSFRIESAPVEQYWKECFSDKSPEKIQHDFTPPRILRL